MIKDYIVACIDLNKLRPSLLTIESPLVSICDGVATLQSDNTKVCYNGNQSVSIARLDDGGRVELSKFESLVVVGEAADQLIDGYDDVVWGAGGEVLYYKIYGTTPTTYVDGEGITYTNTPTKLHGVLPCLE